MMRKRMDVRRALPAVGLLCLAAHSTVSWAQSTDPTSGDVVIFPAPKELEYTPRQAKPKFAVPGAKADEAAGQSTPMSKATGLHLPGNHFRAGEGWWQLLCKATGSCRIATARMGFSAAMHPVYDGEPVESQVLRWTLTDGPAARDEVAIATFKPIRSLAALPLKAGEVPTLLSQAMASYPDTSSLGRRGTMEVRVPTPGLTTLLVPRLKRSEGGQKAKAGSPAKDGDTMVLELREGELRQTIATFDTSGIEGIQPLQRQQYLLWAGDLDGDGKTDYILNLSGSNSSQVSILLSSRAKDGQIVGEVGRFSFTDPSSAGC